MEKNCETCIYNDDRLCDLYGIIVDDNDTCKKWKAVNSNIKKEGTVHD